jgi:inosine-uridine nucleoside N-ribohydrolase
MEFPISTDLAKAMPPDGRLPMVLDTDTYNEIDDQFAVVHALLSPNRLDVQAIYAAPFHNTRSTGAGDGMLKSYEEILRLLDLMGTPSEGLVHRGSPTFLPDWDHPVDSDAAADLVHRAMTVPDGPLYVAAIGAITNIASAILIEPKIVERIVVVWLAGTPPNRSSAREFNLAQDIQAARVILDSGVPLVLIPTVGVASHLLTTTTELARYLDGCGPICEYLLKIARQYMGDGMAKSKVIWDIAAIGYLIDPEWVPTNTVASPVLTNEVTWQSGAGRHAIRVAEIVHRDPIFRDLFAKLRGA